MPPHALASVNERRSKHFSKNLLLEPPVDEGRAPRFDLGTRANVTRDGLDGIQRPDQKLRRFRALARRPRTGRARPDAKEIIRYDVAILFKLDLWHGRRSLGVTDDTRFGCGNLKARFGTDGDRR